MPRLKIHSSLCEIVLRLLGNAISGEMANAPQPVGRTDLVRSPYKSMLSFDRLSQSNLAKCERASKLPMS